MHRWSELFIPTLREAPADAEVASHKFLVRAGYIRQLAAGIYSYLFLGNRSFNKIIAIVRQEMDKIGQEFYLPALHPLSLWEASGRWPQAVGDNLFRLKDRKGADMCLGMTEEEVMTSIALKELRSYKQLPQIWYQIAPKFRDEPRPKSGLLRVRQFMMKDSYSFDIDAAGLDVSYRKHYDAYCRIFDRCGLKYMVVEADSGAMGGKESHEFMVRTPAGEDQIVSCDGCNYAANLEKATSKLAPVEDLKPEGDGKPLPVHTPGQKTIEDVARFLGVSPKNKIKTLALMTDETDAKGKKKSRAIVVLMRGDHQLNEAKLNATVAVATRPMEEPEIERLFNSPAGYLGPIGIEWAKNLKNDAGLPILLVDKALEGRKNLIAGANKKDYHLKNLTPGKDFHPTAYADLRAVTAGEACPNCGKPLRIDTAVEVGHIFKLGYRYSESMGARVLDQNGKEVMPIMGCYGIGIERILTAAVEQGNDEDGFWLPSAIAPFEIVVSPVNMKDQAVKSAAEDIAKRLEAAGFDVILDDRDERPGVKFKDADLVGIPFRITVGKKVTEGTVEVVVRSTHAVSDVTITTIVQHFQALLGPAG
jgi:prolyl-tRNA synthetase